mgnify:CR=1 FL=1
MKIQDLMNTKLETVLDSDPMSVAMRKLREKKIKHLPVLNSSGKLVGIVTDRDLKRANASDATTLEIHELLYLLDKVKVRQIMTRNPVVARPDAGVGAAARLMAQKGIGAMPVCREGKLVGMITTTDLLRRLGKLEIE